MDRTQQSSHLMPPTLTLSQRTTHEAQSQTTGQYQTRSLLRLHPQLGRLPQEDQRSPQAHLQLQELQLGYAPILITFPYASPHHTHSVLASP